MDLICRAHQVCLQTAVVPPQLCAAYLRGRNLHTIVPIRGLPSLDIPYKDFPLIRRVEAGIDG
jgi:hypothetical protein